MLNARYYTYFSFYPLNNSMRYYYTYFRDVKMKLRLIYLFKITQLGTQRAGIHLHIYFKRHLQHAFWVELESWLVSESSHKGSRTLTPNTSSARARFRLYFLSPKETPTWHHSSISSLQPLFNTSQPADDISNWELNNSYRQKKKSASLSSPLSFNLNLMLLSAFSVKEIYFFNWE